MDSRDHLAAVFGALRRALVKLRVHCIALRALARPVSTEFRAADLNFPYPLRTRLGEGLARLLSLDPGPVADLLAGLVAGSAALLPNVPNSKLVYKARIRGASAPATLASSTTSAAEIERDVVVKFCPRRFEGARGGEAVQRLWAGSQLAPRVLGVQRLVGTMDIVVMECLSSEAGWRGLGELAPELAVTFFPAVRAALALAHSLRTADSQATVHGDMRVPNVMVRSGAASPSGSADGGAAEVRFVDFDWAGVAGEVACPTFVNPAVAWPAGMAPGAKLRQEWDRELLASELEALARVAA